MRQGATSRRAREPSGLFGVDKGTFARWQTFWRDHVPQTPFWKIARARLVPVVEIVTLLLSIMDAFIRYGGQYEGWANLLWFLSPITVRGGPMIGICR